MAAGLIWWAPQAWVDGRWQSGVLLVSDAQGCWSSVTPGYRQAPEQASVLAGAALPGLVDAHGHAFQRAFAGLTEQRFQMRDDFWSWRERMYQVAQRLTPALLQAVAAQCFVELLAGGYTQRCEFHYLRRGLGAAAPPDDGRMDEALVKAALETGIGLTVCPVLYERSGFRASGLQPQQQGFHLDAPGVWRVAQRIQALGQPGISAGLAIHSLRAASAESIAHLLRLAGEADLPIHIHVAEQPREVEECLAATGLRPLQWLAQRGGLDGRWHLVHATHVNHDEIDAVAQAAASIVLCPSTEANLGDGLTDVPAWLAAGVPISIGSDSQVGRDWREELRWLELGQRLLRRERNVCALPTTWPSAAERLFEGALSAGSAAAGLVGGGLRVGARADLLVADPLDPALLGLASERTLDALVFSSPVRPWRDVMVAGRWVIRDGQHPFAPRAAERFVRAMQVIWKEQPT